MRKWLSAALARERDIARAEAARLEHSCVRVNRARRAFAHKVDGEACSNGLGVARGPNNSGIHGQIS